MLLKCRQMRYDSGRALVSTDDNRISRRNYFGSGCSVDPFYAQSPEEYRVAR